MGGGAGFLQDNTCTLLKNKLYCPRHSELLNATKSYRFTKGTVMKLKKVICTSVIALLLTFSIVMSLPILVSAEPDLLVHNIDTGLDYATIQEAKILQ